MAAFVTNHKQLYPALSSVVLSMPLSGKTVIITGAGHGVGLYITKAVAEAGAAKVGILGRDKIRIDSAQLSLSKEFPKTTFTAYAIDIADEPGVRACFEDFGPCDILVNNASHFPDEGPFVGQNFKAWFSGYEINVLGTAIMTQQFLKVKTPGSAGIVLVVSSMAAHIRFPLTGWAGYNSSKLAQARIFESLRFEHSDVRFINIHPGNIQLDEFTRSGASPPPTGMTDGKLAGYFFVWAATAAADFLNGRFVWAEWDIEELQEKQKKITEKDILLTTIDGFKNGFY